MTQQQQQYTDPKFPASFTGLDKFTRELEIPYTRRQQVRTELLRDVPAYRLHFPARRRFLRRRVFIPGPFDQWSADLVDLNKWKSSNYGYRYLLTVIDGFTKMAYVEPIRKKTGPIVARAFQRVLERAGRPPKYLQTDMGKEFLADPFQQVLRQHGIKYFYTGSPLKAVQVERFNRTLLQRIAKHMTNTGSKRYVDVLQSIVDGYNHTYHRSIRARPVDVTESNKTQVFVNLYGQQAVLARPSNPEDSPIKVGDTVIVSLRRKNPFRKAYEKTYAPEEFTVQRISRTTPRVYYLRDRNGREIFGGYYKEELLKIP